MLDILADPRASISDVQDTWLGDDNPGFADTETEAGTC